MAPALVGGWEATFRWLLTRRTVTELEWPVTTHGSGPLEESALDEALRDAGLEPYSVSEDSAALVLGRRGWDAATLDQLVRDREGQELRVYSQEMLACFLATGEDPLDGDEAELAGFVEGHPGLEYLAGWGFPWPSTVVGFAGAGGPFDLDRPEKGWLGHLGYSVRASGPSAQDRRAILERAFLDPLPTRGFTEEYVSEWASPGSGRRLRKLAGTIAALCRNAKRKSANMREPVARWESDLEWLRQRYYDRRQRFQWPRT
jgi:hypothetical protein